jgi:hypothetical protein
MRIFMVAAFLSFLLACSVSGQALCPISVTVVMHTEVPPTNPTSHQDRGTYL